ncbi:12237_t:CDS:2 [Cetraspora pellucida]|uniref:12237_t:CDS:1 n=1 Tax=Cetraspora pellucida TaxID=1433469 RepID=A0ACA9KM74_9GLOM|nr:12237_t:CDS:2 [Cetraspora pellucida]
MANKLFKSNNKEYNVKFVKLATDISNIGHTTIHATVECTKAMYQFLTREMPQHWITSATLSHWNNEVAAIAFNQNNISQDMLRSIRQDIKNSEISKKLENTENNNISREEQAYEILNSFLT